MTFRGSKPYFFKEHRSKIVRREFNDANMSKLTNYGLPLKGNVLEFELYQFYRSLVDNDLEMIKNAYSRLYTGKLDYFHRVTFSRHQADDTCQILVSADIRDTICASCLSLLMYYQKSIGTSSKVNRIRSWNI